jgi:hypothetical protein
MNISFENGGSDTFRQRSNVELFAFLLPIGETVVVFDTLKKESKKMIIHAN